MAWVYPDEMSIPRVDGSGVHSISLEVVLLYRVFLTR